MLKTKPLTTRETMTRLDAGLVDGLDERTATACYILVAARHYRGNVIEVSLDDDATAASILHAGDGESLRDAAIALMRRLADAAPEVAPLFDADDFADAAVALADRLAQTVLAEPAAQKTA